MKKGRGFADAIALFMCVFVLTAGCLAAAPGQALALQNQAQLLSVQPLTQRQVELMVKEHMKFCAAAVKAETGCRYIYKRYYDAIYGGKKEPTQEEFMAMKEAAESLIKDVRSSAKKYAGNIAILKMSANGTAEQRTLFARAAAQLFARPAWALDMAALDGIASGMNRIANSTPNIDTRTIKDLLKEKQAQNMSEAKGHSLASKVYSVGLAGSHIAKIGTTALGALLSLIAAPAAGPAAPVVGTAAVIGGVTGTTAAIIDAVEDVSEVKIDANASKARQTLNNISTVASVVGVVSGAQSNIASIREAATKAEAYTSTAQVVLETGTTAKSAIEMITDVPAGAEGAAKVKRALESAGKSPSEGGGNGGGG